MRFRIYVLSLPIIIVIVYVGSCTRAGTWLVKEDKCKHADAIVILTGSIPDRVLQATDLYRQGLARKIIIVEESMGASVTLESRGVHIISNTTQTRDALVDMGIPFESITIVPGDATSTQMESLIIKEFISNKPEIDTIILVSSSFHTRRASMIFRSTYRNKEEPVFFLSNPSKYTYFNAEKWWRKREDIQKVLMEYLKIASFILFEKRKSSGE